MECPTGPVWSLTLIRPWPWCIVGFKPGELLIDPKRIENRSYSPPAGIETGLLVLHAGKNLDSAAATFLSGQLGTLIPDTGTGVVGICRCPGFITGENDDFWYAGSADENGRPNYGWKLADVVAVPRPLRMRGHQSCRRVPTPLARVVRGLYADAIRAGKVVP